MQIVVQDREDDIKQVEDVQANNEYIKPKDLNTAEFEDDGWVNSTYVENITSEFNKSIILTTIEDLKVGDIFELKVKLLQAITDWSIKYGVSFIPAKTNRTCHIAV